jgi:hypothetical protein
MFKPNNLCSIFKYKIYSINNMSLKNTKLVEDLILFYVKENYLKYLQEKKISKIPEDEIPSVIETLYSDRKVHLKEFLKVSLKKLMNEEYIGDLAVQSICNEIFSDDDVCKQRLITEINIQQNQEL